MAFTTNDVNVYYPVDKDQGGRIAYTQIVSAQGGNVIPLALPSDLAAGREIHRKMGFRIDDLNNGIGVESFVRLWKKLASIAYKCWFPVTRRWINTDLIGTEEKYGTATLKFAALSIDTAITVTVKHADHASGNDAIFKDGKLLSICAADQLPTTDSALQGYAEVTGDPSVSGLDLTLTLTAALGVDYAAGALIQTFPAKIDVTTNYENFVDTSIGTTTFDPVDLVLDNIGTATLSVDITMLTSTTFSAVGDWDGIVSAGTTDLGVGQISTAYAPLNINNSRPLFTVPAGAIGGAPVAGDTFSFNLNGAEYPIVIKHVIPPSTTSISGDVSDVFFETASVS